MGDLFKVWEAIEKIAETADAVSLECSVCMLIDYTAAKCGISSKELLEKITPIIISCNEELGQMVIGK